MSMMHCKYYSIIFNNIINLLSGLQCISSSSSPLKLLLSRLLLNHYCYHVQYQHYFHILITTFRYQFKIDKGYRNLWLHLLLKCQVIFPTGIKVVLERNYWGIDVTIYAPQAEKEANEDGLCKYTKGDINTFGNSQRQEYLVQSQFGLIFVGGQ